MKKSSGVCLGGIAVSVSLLDESESLFVSSTTPPLSYFPRRLRYSVTLSLFSMAHLVEESLQPVDLLEEIKAKGKALGLLDVELNDVLCAMSEMKLDAF